MRLLRLCGLSFGLLFGLLSAQPVSAATADLFGGSLGAWLREEAIPELTTLLGKHPRFRGERIRVVAMVDGQPATTSDRLTQSIREQLTHRLTRVKGVQLAWRESATACGVPRATPYLLGVEVVRESGKQHLVRVAMVDVEEGVWVSGAHLQWRGVLTSDERQAYGRRVVDAPLGTIDQPLHANQRSAVVEQLLKGAQCSLRGGLDGDVYVQSADQEDAFLTSLSADMRQRLSQSALLSLADNASGADWWLMLSAQQDVAESVVATLVTPQDQSKSGAAPQSTQRLAVVYIDRGGAANRQLARRDTPPTTGSRTRTPAAPEHLIEGLHEVLLSAGDQCYAYSARCTEIQFELAAASYLLVLRTGPEGGVKLGQCAVPKRTAGKKRFRLSLHHGGAGFYAVATTDQALAKRLHTALAAGADNCSRRPAKGWLERLDALIAAAPGQIDWQPFYVGDLEVAGSTAVASRWKERRE